MDRIFRGRIGIALGSGSARGWAHVGVLRGLAERGVHPEIVCGCSAGALVGGLFAAGRLDGLERFGRQLDFRQMLGYFDLSLRGGVIKARRLMEFLTAELEDCDAGALGLPFGAVATDLETGREVWLREGPIVDVLRASAAMPGLVAPVWYDGRWLVDGGLVNAVPVSLCRAMGAETVIAVDLNTTLLARRFRELAGPPVPEPVEEESVAPTEEHPSGASAFSTALTELLESVRERVGGSEAGPSTPPVPSIYEVVANALNIMQVRIGQSRMAGDPPELLITPRLEDFGLLDFDRAHEGIEAGRRAAYRALDVIAAERG